MDRLQALTQGDQALGVKEVVGPPLMIAAPASAFASAALAQDASQPASRVAVDCRKHVALAVLEVFKPALQEAVELVTGRWSFASSCSPPRLSAAQLLSATKGQLPLRWGLSPNSWSTLVGALASAFAT